MKIKPFGTLVLVEKLEVDKTKASGIIMTETRGDMFAKFKVLAVGDKVTNVRETIPELIVLAHDLVEYIEPGGKIGFISETHIFGEVEE